MPLVTEEPPRDFTKDKNTSGQYTYRGQRVVSVTPTAGDPVPMTYAQAIAAIAAKGIDFDAPYNDDYGAGAVLTGLSQTYNVVAGMWTFTATYGDGGDSFLAQPALIKFQPYTYTQPYDFDQSDPPVAYTATSGTPFGDSLEIENNGVLVKIRTPRSTFNAAMIFTYGNTTNKTPLVLPHGAGTIPVDCAKFIPPEVEAFSQDSNGIYVDLCFDCRPDGWFKRVIDQSPRGYGRLDDGTAAYGIFTYGDASGPAGSVRLDGEGMPLLPDFKVKPQGFSNGLDPYSPPIDVGSQELIDAERSTSSITILKFRLFKQAELNDLIP